MNGLKILIDELYSVAYKAYAGKPSTARQGKIKARRDIVDFMLGVVGENHFDDGDPQTIGRNSEKEEIRERLEALR